MSDNPSAVVESGAIRHFDLFCEASQHAVLVLWAVVSSSVLAFRVDAAIAPRLPPPPA